MTRQDYSVIDAHVHLGPPKYAVLDAYLDAMSAYCIDEAVLVQHLGNTDNSYLAAARSTHLERFAALAIVDRVADVAPVLAAGFAGLRLAPHGLPGADGAAVFDVLDEYRAVISVTGPREDVVSARFRQTVRAHPGLQFRIEHVGGFRYGASALDRDEFAGLLRLADEQNVTLMWSGFFLNAGSEYPYANTHADLRQTLAAYGSGRIMWSGDWNRDGLGAGEYRQAIDLVSRVVSDDSQLVDILRGTAARVFGLASDGDRKVTNV